MSNSKKSASNNPLDQLNDPDAADSSVTSPALVTLADEFCPRQITFTIPGKVGVKVTATENHGKIEFVVDAIGSGKDSADLRGLFFHFTESKLAGLKITGGDGFITGTQIKANSVIDLGHGDNMHGKANPFDIGIAFGTPGAGRDFVDGPVHFTLSDTANDLTLDDFAHLQFGARTTSTGDKIVTIAPAAPDAKDDCYHLFEDGAPGLDSPSKSPVPIVLAVLANDFDGDGDQLFITDVHQDAVHHGTVAISADGRSILYTPDLDYSGPDSFEYCVSDGHGGQDNATVTLSVTAVADLPTFDVQVLPGADVYHMILKVTASQNDADSSEFIDRIDASVPGGLPAGVTITPIGGINPSDEPDQIVRQYEVALPVGQDTKFDLNLTAVSKETSNGDEQSATKAVTIELDFTRNVIDRTFEANDRSIWSDANAIGFADQDFFGVNKTFDDSPEFTLPVPIPGLPLVVNATADVDGHFKFGFQYDIEINGGKINADAPMEITVDSAYNHTTDALVIDAKSITLPGLSFTTDGPGGHFFFDVVTDVDVNLDLAITIPVIDATLRALPDKARHIDIDQPSFRIIDISDQSSISIPLPLGFNVTAAFPADIDASGSVQGADPNVATGKDDSNDFAQVDWNVGVAVSQIFPLLSPLFNQVPVIAPPLVGSVTPITASIGVGADVVQTFTLTMQALNFKVILEDGASYALGEQILNASSHDLDGDGVEYTVVMDPQAQLINDTDIGVNFDWNLDLVRADLTVPLPVDDLADFAEDVLNLIPFVDVDIPDSVSIHKALIDLGQVDVPVTTIDVSKNQFALDFQSQSVALIA